MRKTLTTALLLALVSAPAATTSSADASTAPPAVTVPAGQGRATSDPTDEPDRTASTSGSRAATERATARGGDASRALKKPLSRERVKLGDWDTSPKDIDHVREVQYRLRWLGLYDGHVNGKFNHKTRTAVIHFQRRNNLTQTGRVGPGTWPRLIRQSIRGQKFIPHYCKGSGWRICYDRARHQVFLFHNGRMYNSWLVRGGDRPRNRQTRTGTFSVYRRDIDHVSTLYGSPMPYSQFFSGGQAFHGSSKMLDPFSGHSHGCVNMYIKDARQLWALTHDKRLLVRVYGHWS